MVFTILINKLKSLIFRKKREKIFFKDYNDVVDECRICFELFVADARVKLLTCYHLFHEVCIDRWMKYKATCPYCREIIETDEDATQIEHNSDMDESVDEGAVTLLEEDASESSPEGNNDEYSSEEDSSASSSEVNCDVLNDVIDYLDELSKNDGTEEDIEYILQLTYELTSQTEEDTE